LLLAAQEHLAQVQLLACVNRLDLLARVEPERRVVHHAEVGGMGGRERREAHADRLELLDDVVARRSHGARGFRLELEQPVFCDRREQRVAVLEVTKRRARGHAGAPRDLAHADRGGAFVLHHEDRRAQQPPAQAADALARPLLVRRLRRVAVHPRRLAPHASRERCLQNALTPPRPCGT